MDVVEEEEEKEDEDGPDTFILAPSPNAATERLASLSAMRKKGELCDVELVTDDGANIAAHRVILAASSPYFSAMFSAGLKESNCRIVRLKDIEREILEAVVSYAYNAECSLAGERVLSLLIAADRLQMQPLCAECCAYLETRLRPENCLGFGAFAEQHNCPRLHQLSTEFALNHFERVVQNDEFLSLPSTRLTGLISRDEVRVTSEEDVYKAVLAWVYHDLERRRSEFENIMSHVRLPFVSAKFLYNEVQEETLMKAEKCREFLQEALLYKSSPEKRPSLRHSPRTRPRKPSGLQDVILTVGGMGKSKPVSSVEQYDISIDSWTHLTEMEVPCFGLKACFIDGCLFATGGYSESFGYLNLVQCYTLRSNRWTIVSPMQTPRRYHSAEVLYGLLYVSGGQNVEGSLDSVERYDPSSNTWSPVAPMQSRRMYHGMVELDGSLFSIGGHDGQTRLNTVECYDPNLNQWTLVCPMSIVRSVPGVASLGGSIYIAGGYDGKHYLDSVERYDAETDEWSQCPAMTTQRSALGLVSYYGCLYACGGFNGGFLCSVERFSRGGTKWEAAVSMQAPRVHFGATCS